MASAHRVRCPGCGVTLKTEGLPPGKALRCPKCSQHFTLPRVPPTAVPAAPPAARPAPAAPARAPAPRAVPVAKPAASPPHPMHRTPATLARAPLLWAVAGVFVVGVVFAGVFYFKGGPRGSGKENAGGGGGGNGEVQGGGGGNTPVAGGAGKPVDLGRPIHLVGHKPDPIIGMAFSPDGTRLASMTAGSEVILWNLATGSGQVLAAGTMLKDDERLAQRGTFRRHVAFSPDGTTLYAGSLGGVTAWDVASGAGQATFGNVDARVLQEIVLAPDGKTLATSPHGEGAEGRIEVWDTATHKPVMKLEYDIDKTVGDLPLSYAPDGKTLAALLWNGEFKTPAVIRVFDIEKRRELPPIQDLRAQQYVFLTNNTLGVWGDPRGSPTYSVWDLGDRTGPARLVSRQEAKDRSDAHPFEQLTTSLFGVISPFSPDRKTLAAPVSDGKFLDYKTWLRGEGGVGLYDFDTHKLRGKVRGVSPWVFTPDNRTVVALAGRANGARPGTVTLVEADAGTGQTRAVFEVACPGVPPAEPDKQPDHLGLAVPPTRSDVVALALGSGTVVIHPLHGAYPPALKEVASLPFDIQEHPRTSPKDHNITRHYLEFTPDGRYLIGLGVGGPANTLWDARAKKHLLTADKYDRGRGPRSVLLPSVIVLPEQDQVYSLASNGVGQFALETGALKDQEGRDDRPRSSYCQEIRLAPDGKTAAAVLSADERGDKQLRFGLVDPVTLELRKELTDYTGRSVSGQGIAFSPDGKLVATFDRKLRLFELPSGRERPTTAEEVGGFGPRGLVPAFADGSNLMVCYGEPSRKAGILAFYNPGTGQKIREVVVDRGHNAFRSHGGTVAVSPGSPVCATTNRTGEVLLHDLKTGDLRYRVQAHTQDAIVTFSPDGKLIATASLDGKLKFWEVGDVPPEKNFGTPQVVTLRAPAGSDPGSGPVTTPTEVASFSVELDNRFKANDTVPLVVGPGGRFVAAQTPFGPDDTPGPLMQLWDVSSRKRVRTSERFRVYAHATADGRRVYNDALESLDLESGKETPAADDFVPPACYAFHPDGKTVAFGMKGSEEAKEKLLRFVEFPSRKERRSALEAFGGAVTALAYSPDGKHLMADVRDKEGAHALLWLNPDTGAVVSKLGDWTHDRKATFLAFSADGKTFALAGEYEQNDVRVSMWDVVSGKRRHTFKLADGCEGLAFVDGGGALAVQIGGDVVVYDVATGKERHRTNFNDTSECRSWYQVLCPARGLFISLREKGEVIVWDMVNKKLVSKLEAHPAEIVGLAVSPDETAFATIGLDNKVKVWSLVGKRPK